MLHMARTSTSIHAPPIYLDSEKLLQMIFTSRLRQHQIGIDGESIRCSVLIVSSAKEDGIANEKRVGNMSNTATILNINSISSSSITLQTLYYCNFSQQVKFLPDILLHLWFSFDWRNTRLFLDEIFRFIFVRLTLCCFHSFFFGSFRFVRKRSWCFAVVPSLDCC